MDSSSLFPSGQYVGGSGLNQHRTRLQEGAELPVEIESHGQQIGLCLSERRLRACKGMNPIEHDSRAIGPVPVESEGEIVVLAFADVAQIQVRPTSFGFQTTPA